MTDPVAFPRKIYFLWFQGVENAPCLVRWNLTRWIELNPDYDVITLDAKTSATYLDDLAIDPTSLSLQAQSDIIRLCILRRHGGIWVDASVLPIKPLNSWLPEAADKSDFFAYEREGVVLPMSSWFLAAKHDALIIRKWYEATLHYWSVKRDPLQEPGQPLFVPDDPSAIMAPFEPQLARPYPYFWLHHLFGILISTDFKFKEEWEKRHRKPAADPHLFAEFYNRSARPNSGVKRVLRQISKKYSEKRIIAKVKCDTEMQKLDWRVGYPRSLLDALL